MKKIMGGAAALLAVGMVCAGLGTFAVASNSQNTNSSTNSNSNMNRNSNSGGNMNRGMMASSADARFMMTAAAGGVSEVEMARLALERSSSDEVKRYAQRMVEDHTKANEELMQVAASKGITLPTTPDAKHMALMTKMRGMSGMNFDRMYVKEAGVKDHQNMEKLFQKESTGGKDADVRAFAARTLPAVQMHLSMAREMSNSMSGKKSNGNSNTGNMNMD